MFDWDLCKVVLAISRTGSMSAAALQLGIDQTTIGRRLTALEKQLGTPLFVRSKSGFCATESGDIVIEYARRVEARFEVMTDRISETASSTGGLVRLAGNTWMLELLTGGVLAPLLNDHRNLELRLSGRLPPAPLHAEPSISLWFDAEPHAPEKAHPFCTVPYAVYRSRNAAPGGGDWVQYRDDLANGPSFARQVSRRLPEGAGVRLTATDAQILKAAVVSGLGQGTLPVCIGDADAGLERVRTASSTFDRVLHLHLSDDSLHLPRVRIVLDRLLAGLPSIFGGRQLINRADVGLSAASN